MKKENKKAGEKSALTQPATEKANLKSSKRTAKSQIKGFKKKGWVRWWRGFSDDPLWKQKRKFSNAEAYLDLWVEARGLDTPRFVFKKRIVNLKRGQLITSQYILAKRWGWHRNSVVRFLKILERRKTITVSLINLGRNYSIITLLQYNELNPIITGEKTKNVSG